MVEIVSLRSGARVDAVKKEPIAWLKERNQCAKMQAQEVCTRDRYLQRIAWLRASSKAARGADDQGISLGPVAYRCDKTDGRHKAGDRHHRHYCSARCPRHRVHGLTARPTEFHLCDPASACPGLFWPAMLRAMQSGLVQR